MSYVGSTKGQVKSMRNCCLVGTSLIIMKEEYTPHLALNQCANFSTTECKYLKLKRMVLCEIETDLNHLQIISDQ